MGKPVLVSGKHGRFPYPVRGRGGSPTPPIAFALSLQALRTPEGFPWGGPCRPGLSEGIGQATAGEFESLMDSQSRAAPGWMAQDLMF